LDGEIAVRFGLRTTPAVLFVVATVDDIAVVIKFRQGVVLGAEAIAKVP
jgi:hypothetical protein